MYAQFTDKAREAVRYANTVAGEYNHEYIGTEHLLLALLRIGPSPAVAILSEAKISATRLEQMVAKIVHKGPEPVGGGKKPHTPRAKKVLEFALEESRKLAHSYVGTEHLLLGLIREQEGVAAMVLQNAGISLAQAIALVPKVIADERAGVTTSFFTASDEAGPETIALGQAVVELLRCSGCSERVMWLLADHLADPFHRLAFASILLGAKKREPDNKEANANLARKLGLLLEEPLLTQLGVNATLPQDVQGITAEFASLRLNEQEVAALAALARSQSTHV